MAASASDVKNSTVHSLRREGYSGALLSTEAKMLKVTHSSKLQKHHVFSYTYLPMIKFIL
jgi:hypothetical protein